MTPTSSKLPVKRAFSAGGVVYRRHDLIEIVICGHNDAEVWALPKGTPRKGERLEATALREVEEETGLRTRITDKIGYVQYWFVEDGIRYFKTVYYYLMQSIGGDMSDHDPEFDEVRWCEISEALKILTYKNDADIVSRAQQMIRSHEEARDGAV